MFARIYQSFETTSIDVDVIAMEKRCEYYIQYQLLPLSLEMEITDLK